MEDKTVIRKSWSDFRETGLLLFINQILHAFGWALVFKMNDDVITEVYPARVTFRGFNSDSVSKSYNKIAKYMNENSEILLNETKDN